MRIYGFGQFSKVNKLMAGIPIWRWALRLCRTEFTD